MTKAEVAKRIIKLRREINYHRRLYHVLDRQEISDAALDSLKKELFDLEQQYLDLITTDSPTQRIGGQPLDKFKKTRHETPMLSFNDAFSEQDMQDWLRRLQNYLGQSITPLFYCELKLDGLAIELVYQDGLLVQASTRGDGQVGEDVTQNIKTIDAIPLNLEKGDWPKKLIVRGEVFLTKKEFNRINQELEKAGKKTYANPRNLAAGSIRQLDPKITASRRLDSFAYDIALPPNVLKKAGLDFKNHSEEHAALKNWGFKTNPNNKKCGSLAEVFKIQKYWNEHRDKLPYEIDGLVVLVDDNKIYDDGGVIGKAPRAGIAYKFSAKEATTIVENIRVYIGRTGTLTPVAQLRPVQVGGITITHASLHNMDEIGRLSVKIGDTVVVSRAGDVIPQITQVLKKLRSGKEKEFKMPTHCPLCNSNVIKEGVFYRCVNKKCLAVQSRQLYHFVSRSAFNIEGLGRKIINRFLDEGLIRDAADIFTLEKGDIAVLPGFGEKSADNIINEIKQRSQISLARFIYSLGILHVGEETARALAHYFKSINKLSLATIEELQVISDIGPKVAESIVEWFKDRRNQALLEKLNKVGIKITAPETGLTAGRLRGQSFVITGTLSSMSRDQAKEKLRALGADINESVSVKTSFVVAGDNPGSKFDKAKKLGVKILNEKEFLKTIK